MIAAPRIPQTAPQIAALPSTTERPQWSVMIPTYNCTPFLREALRSVLAQDPGAARMQIEVVDDASTDEDVAAVVAALGAGRVQYYRQPANVGSLRNFETCLNRARGHLVHLLHGDDRVRPGFYAQVGQLLARYPAAGAAFTHYASVDEHGAVVHDFEPVQPAAGILPNWLVRLAETQYIQYACMVVRREVYEHLGSFYGTTCGEDWEMWVRIARHYPVAYSPETLAEYRGHPGSVSWKKAQQGQLLADWAQVIARIEEHLPPDQRQKVGRLARKRSAQLGIGEAYHALAHTKSWAAAHGVLAQALRLSPHPATYYQVLKFYAKVLLRWRRLGL
ncbi:glycosyltransferase family 2 protein [Hymenobacter bucti]|uniref:Glycosyltransferase family 2 protein n=1 Tax=Hymenobacter bucti TaxID=1844114 RepID=A0ABW4QZ15_9BACT